MEYFIKKVCGFVFTGIVLTVILYVILSSNHKFLPSINYYNKEFNKAFKNKDYELIALGNSKLLSSIDAIVLNKNLNLRSVNLGYSSSDISISKLTLETYLNKCLVKPKVVLLEVSWFTFNTNRTFFHPFAGDLFLVDYKMFKYFTKYYPLTLQSVKSSSFDQIKSYMTPTSYIDYNSLLQKDTNPQVKDYTFNNETFEALFPTHNAGVNTRLLEDFNSLVSICKKNKIKLILYTAPEDEEYSDLQYDRNQIKNIFHSTDKNYDHVLYLDYTKGGRLYDKKYEYWLYDSHHINEKSLFTNILSNDIKKSNVFQR